MTIPTRPPLHQLLRNNFTSWSVILLVIPIGVSHISSWLQGKQSREWEKRTKNKRAIWAWVNSSARRLSCDTLHSLCICRLTLAWISSEISTKLLGMPTRLDWSSLTAAGLYLMPTGLSAVRCRLPTALLHLPSPTAFSASLFQLLDSHSLAHFRSRGDLDTKPFVWFRADRQRIVCLADHPHSVTETTSNELKYVAGKLFMGVFQCIQFWVEFCPWIWKRDGFWYWRHKYRSECNDICGIGTM